MVLAAAGFGRWCGLSLGESNLLDRLVRVVPAAAQHHVQGYGDSNSDGNERTHKTPQSVSLWQHLHYRQHRQDRLQIQFRIQYGRVRQTVRASVSG